MRAKQVEEELLTKHEKKKESVHLLSSGITPLNCAISGNFKGAFRPGHYYFIVGDSDSGKTVIVLTICAEAMASKFFRKYDIIYDGPEYGAMMDLDKFYGSSVANNLLPPAGTKEEPKYSETVEDFYFNLDDAIKRKRPFIYILDSQDALDSESELRRFQERKKAYRKGKELGGSYGDGKAAKHSGNLRKFIVPLHNAGSMLFIVGQAKDNIGMFITEPQTVAGGHSLKFYATVQLWSNLKGKIKVPYKGKNKVVGIRVKIRTKKNRLTGRDAVVEFPIHWSHGIDDIGACVDYLVNEGHWTDKGGILAKELGYKDRMKREELVHAIEEGGDEFELRALVGKVWHEIDAACAVRRKKRYS